MSVESTQQCWYSYGEIYNVSHDIIHFIADILTKNLTEKVFNFDLADSATLLTSMSMNTTVLDVTWVDRLGIYWNNFPSFILGMALSMFVIYLSVFSKKISGDYKWLVLNQAIANFLYAAASLSYEIIYFLYLGPSQYSLYYYKVYYFKDSADVPFWFKLFTVVIYDQFILKGYSALMTTLFANVFNRWAAIMFPERYTLPLTKCKIFFYFLLCYLAVLPFDMPLLQYVGVSIIIVYPLWCGSYIVPWILSVIFGAMIWVKLWAYRRSVSSYMDERHRKEARHGLYALTFQVVVSFFEKVPECLFQLGSIFGLPINNLKANSTFFYYFHQVVLFNMMCTNVYTCLIILITMRPYREATISAFSSVFRKCCKKKSETVNTITVVPSSQSKSALA